MNSDQINLLHAVNIYVYKNGLSEYPPTLVHIPPEKKKNMQTALEVIQLRLNLPVGYPVQLYYTNGIRVCRTTELEMYCSYVAVSNLDRRFKCAEYGRPRTPLVVIGRASKNIKCIEVQEQSYNIFSIKMRKKMDNRAKYAFAYSYTSNGIGPQQMPFALKSSLECGALCQNVKRFNPDYARNAIGPCSYRPTTNASQVSYVSSKQPKDTVSVDVKSECGGGGAVSVRNESNDPNSGEQVLAFINRYRDVGGQLYKMFQERMTQDPEGLRKELGAGHDESDWFSDHLFQMFVERIEQEARSGKATTINSPSKATTPNSSTIDKNIVVSPEKSQSKASAAMSNAQSVQQQQSGVGTVGSPSTGSAGNASMANNGKTVDFNTMSDTRTGARGAISDHNNVQGSPSTRNNSASPSRTSQRQSKNRNDATVYHATVQQDNFATFEDFYSKYSKLTDEDMKCLANRTLPSFEQLNVDNEPQAVDENNNNYNNARPSTSASSSLSSEDIQWNILQPTRTAPRREGRTHSRRVPIGRDVADNASDSDEGERFDTYQDFESRYRRRDLEPHRHHRHHRRHRRREHYDVIPPRQGEQYPEVPVFQTQAPQRSNRTIQRVQQQRRIPMSFNDYYHRTRNNFDSTHNARVIRGRPQGIVHEDPNHHLDEFEILHHHRLPARPDRHHGQRAPNVYQTPRLLIPTYDSNGNFLHYVFR